MTQPTVQLLNNDGWRTAGGTVMWKADDKGLWTKQLNGLVKRSRSMVLTDLAAKLFETHQEDILNAEAMLGVAAPLMLTTMVAESGGQANAERYEAHLADYSIGVCQTLTATASALGELIGWTRLDSSFPEDVVHFAMPPKSVPRGGCF